MKDHSAMGSPGGTPAGVSLSGGGYVLSPVTAPATPDASGELSFQIQSGAGVPVTDFAVSHEKDLHLIVVRSDGTGYRHVHPVLDKGTGTWSLPWRWDEAGTYRIYADFTLGQEGAGDVTLTRTVQVAGQYQPVAPEPSTSSAVDGFTVSIAGELIAGTPSDLTVSVSRDGEPVTTLEPYLGAFGHLVALREGDLAYLHVHAHGDDPEPGDTSGPDIAFTADTPTPGRYLLYLDFQVNGQVHTAEFVLDAAPAEGATTSPHDEGSHSH